MNASPTLSPRDLERLAHWTVNHFLARQDPAWQAKHEEDVRQYAMIEAWRYYQNFDPQRSFQPSTYVVNCLKGRLMTYRRDVSRHEDRLPTVSLERPIVADGRSTVADLVADPRDLLGQAEAAADVDALLARLEPDEERLLRLRFWDGLSLRDCEEPMQLGRTAVMRIERQALRKLRKILGVNQ